MVDVTTKPVRKAVIAAAGFGTRFLPQTKAMPKEMLPIVDKPVIQYVVEELVGAGIEDIIIVTGYSKRAIEDHFDGPSQDLITNLENANKLQLLKETQAIGNLANFIYIRQKGPYGNATPLLNAEHLIGDEPFIFTWGDDFVKAQPSRFKQLVEAYAKHGGSVISCVKASTDEDYKRYGFVAGEPVDSGIIDIKKIVEKPGSKQDSPSDLATVSSYLFSPEIFEYLRQAQKLLQPSQEFIMQPIMQKMIDEGHKFYGCEIKGGVFYDTGNKLEYLKTVVDFALMHDDIKDDFADFLRDKIS